MIGERSVWRGLLLASGFALLLGCAGCGPATGEVSGTVTYEGKPLKGGSVTFATTDGKNGQTSEIKEDGTYTVHRVLVGPAAITVETRSLLGAKGAMTPQGGRPGQGQGPPAGMRMTPPPGATPEGAVGNPMYQDRSAMYVEIPKRYQDADTSGLNYDVKRGPQNYDIKLSK
jgi:hypothetical protein